MRTIAVIGCGALGTIFCQNAVKLLSKDYQITSLLANHFEHAQTLAQSIGVTAVHSAEELLATNPDIVVEFAGRDALKQYGEKILSQGCDLVAVSAGALADESFKERLIEAARLAGSRLYIPNGAIGGLDLMQTFALMGNAQLTIGNTKAPKSLNGAPYLKGQNLPEDQKVTVFTGSVKDAIEGFPKNVNVAVVATLATDPEQVQVTIQSDPTTEVNTHHLQIKNDLMTAEITIASKPDPRNPKSSTSTAWSVIALLKNLASPIRFY